MRRALSRRGAFVPRGGDIFHRLPGFSLPRARALFSSSWSLLREAHPRPHVYSRVSRTKDIPRARNVTCFLLSLSLFISLAFPLSLSLLTSTVVLAERVRTSERVLKTPGNTALTRERAR